MKITVNDSTPGLLLKRIPGCLFLLYCLLIVQQVSAQVSARPELSGIMASIKNTTDRRPVEKLFFQLDKPQYSIGDTLWFKSYLFDSYLNASSLSGVLYVELANDSNLVQKRIMLPVTIGLSWGNIALDDNFLPGYYTLRAYTNWMRNFSEDYFFKKRIYIGDTSTKQWLIKMHPEVLKNDGRDNAHINLQVNNFDNTPISPKAIQVKVVNGNSSLFQDALSATDEKGLEINFPLPEKNLDKRMGLILQDVRKGAATKRMFVPLFLNRPEDNDLQFFPESGNLLSDINSNVGFKAVGEDGRGVNISGSIVNSKGEKITTFKSDYKGMGSFNLQPVSGESYNALVVLPDGKTKIYPLPLVRNTGISLSITNSSQSDSLGLTVICTPGIMEQNSGCYIIGQSRGVTCLGGFIRLHKRVTKLTIDKKNFPSGIARFTLLNTDKEPVNERITFINQDDLLHIKITPNKKSYSKRDSITLDIQVTDKDNTPLEASFSLAVTDDNQVKADSSNDNTIVSDLLLTSDLKGTIEDPGYYFENMNNAETWKHLDNLMLTQGWIGYDWNTIFSLPKLIAYHPEPYFSVKGKVTNIFNKPVSNSGVVLLARNPMLIKDTVTNTAGEFAFSNLFPQDTAIFLLQARNKNGKSFNVGIEVDDFKPPVFEKSIVRTIPWFVNIDTTAYRSLSNQALYKKENEKVSGKTKMLQEVFVIGKKIIKDSKNLNGAGEADLTLTTADLEKAGKTTLGMLMEKNVRGFGIGGKNGRTYVVFTMKVHLIIDGVYVESLKPGGVSLYDYYKNFFDYYTAEDIKGIEVMRTGKYQMSYAARFLHPLEIPWEHVFIEITTYGGQGPFLKKVPGIYLYKPMPFSVAKKFYVPKYNTDSITNFVDIRSTIHWEPNIITDKQGKATVSFYAADHPGVYTIIIQGSDMNGNIGATRQKLLVKMPEGF